MVYGVPFDTVEALSESDPRRAEALGAVTGPATTRELRGNYVYFLAITKAASLTAELRMRPRVHPAALIMGGCSSDWGMVAGVAEILRTTPARIYTEAKKTVNASWAAIEVVARELDRVGKLDYEGVKRLYEDCSVKTIPIQLTLDFPIDLGS